VERDKSKMSSHKLQKTVKKSKTSRKNKEDRSSKQALPPIHHWRVCPYGEHWVRTHPMQVPPSQTHPDGIITTRSQHCARNSSGKDHLYPGYEGTGKRNS
jgi:hypothetical protein